VIIKGGRGPRALRVGRSLALSIYRWPESVELREPRANAEASELVSIPRAELDALKAELKRLRREVGKGVAKARSG
jgi:hypothetical protein